MKHVILSLLFGIVGMSVAWGQNEIQEAYFHDLQGFEDSAGTTQLFYRLYQHYDEDYDINEEDSCWIWRNDVSHYDTATETDSVKFESLRQIQCEMRDTPISTVESYQFPYNDVNKWFTTNFRHGIYDNNFGRPKTYNGSFFDAGGASSDKFDIVQTDSLSYGVYDFRKSSILIVLKNDSLPSIGYPYVMLVKASEEAEQEPYCPNGEAGNCFYGRSDSVFIYGHNFLSVDHNQAGGLYFQRNDSLFWSDDLGKTMHFRNDDFDWSSMDVFLYGRTDSTLIATTKFKYNPLGTPPDSPQYHQLLKSTDNGQNWEEIWGDSSKIYTSQTLDENGTFYAGNKQTVYQGSQYGDTFDEFMNFDHPVTGLYKKPDSELLYVLTKEELLEVNIETKSTTSLKQLPVSSEQYTEVPSRVELEQNYPNPFNPTTVIRYQLNSNQLVRLEVFDVAGRKVATLVDGTRQAAGSHRISFDASNLSSGVYFYRLQAGGQTLTRKMLLVK